MKDEFHAVRPPVNGSRKSHASKESEPYVGIFYDINGKLHWEGVPTTKATTSGYVRVYPKEHGDYWQDCIVKQLPHLRTRDAEDFPRGRVVFSTQEGIYRLQADQCVLQNPRLVKQIVAEMRLPESKVKLSWNVDCECARCESNRIACQRYTERDVEMSFTSAQDGRAVFFPWKSFWPSKRGYIVPADEEYELRRGVSLWLKLVLPTTVFIGFIVANRTRDLTESWWMSGLMFLATFIPFFISFAIWLGVKCRGLKRTDGEL